MKLPNQKPSVIRDPFTPNRNENGVRSSESNACKLCKAGCNHLSFWKKQACLVVCNHTVCESSN